MAMRYGVVVDREKCMACGVAPSLCPGVFELAGPGGNRVREPYEVGTDGGEAVGVVPEELYECVREAAESCPVEAISVEPLGE